MGKGNVPAAEGKTSIIKCEEEHMKKVLYFDCSSGISGDMTLGALLDLGADQETFLRELEKLHLDGYRIHIGRTERNGIQANLVDVQLVEEHCHETQPAQEHNGQHAHEQEEHHVHTHVHRSFGDIRTMITESELDPEVKELALRIFLRVAKAEAKVHGKTVEEVHFHEVGAVDSIVDIVGCAILIHMINPDAVYASVVQDGYGFVTCQHGILPVPVPAVLGIFAESDAVLRQIDVDTEMVTPTGAAIIAELAQSFGTMPAMKITAVGRGAGTKILPVANILQVIEGRQR